MSNKQQSFAEHMFHHLVDHGIIAMLIAGYYLVELRGVEARQFFLFGIPPLVAVLFTRHGKSVTTRSMAWGFLGMVGVGSLIAPTPALFPNLGSIDRQLGVHHDRMLSWYAGVYVVWLAGILPIGVFRQCLRDHRDGRPTQFSRPTCYLGLMTTALMWIGLPHCLAVMGFWPVI